MEHLDANIIMILNELFHPYVWGTGLLTAILLFYMIRQQQTIAEHRQTANRLREAKEYTENILASMGDALLVVSLEGTIQSANWAACDLLEFPENNLVGMSIDQIFVEEVCLPAPEVLAKLQSGLRHFETSLRSSDGKTIPVLLSGAVMHDPDGVAIGMVCVAKDISDRKQVEEQRDRLLEFQKAQSDILRISLEPWLLEQTLEQALRRILEIPFFAILKKGSLFLVQDEAQERNEKPVLHLVAHVGFPAQLREACARVPLGHCLCGRAAESGEIVFSSHIDDRHDITYPGIEPHGHYCIPILADDRLLGVLNLYVHKGYVRTPEDEKFLQSITDTLSGIIARDQLEQNIRKQTAQLAASHTLLEERETFLRTVLASARDAIITMDHQNRIVEFNPAAEQMFGYARAEAMGCNLTELIIPSDLRDRHRQAVARFNRTGRPTLSGWVELPGLRANRTIIDLEVAITPIEVQGKMLFTAVLHDISEKKQATALLKASLDAAKSASRAKSEFIANMSHEIRTPMNAIIGLTNLAIRSEPAPKLYDFLSKIENASHSLMSIINDILDFSRIEAGRVKIDRLAFDPHLLFDRLADLFSQQATEKGIELILSIPPDFCRVAMGDALRLEQVLINLIRNAIKFTERGVISVEVQSNQRGTGAAEWTFSVTDTGIGIAPETLPQLFEPFVQADGSTTRKYGGTGLGLSISKRLVEMMGGQIGAESVPGEGSVFSFTVALECRSLVEADPPVIPGVLKGLRVLVVDDHPITRRTVQNFLKSFRFEVQAVDSGETALSELLAANTSTSPYGLVVMDWVIPGMDGITTAREVKKQLASHPIFPGHIPKIILLTAHSGEKAQRHTSGVELDAIIEKPASRSQLLDAIMTVFGEKPLQRRQSSQVLASETETQAKIGSTRVLVVEDNVINRQVARELLQRVGLVVETVNNGVEAVRAVQETRYDAVLMDIQMPEMDGYQATRRIRSEPRFETLPIIAMTAHAMPEEQKKCLAAGMNAHLAKPIQPERLYATLTQWIGPMVVPDVGKEGDGDQRPLPQLPGMDTVAGLQRMGGNRAGFLGLLIRFREDHAETATELQNALAQGDRRTAHRLAHTIKGVAGTIGAEALQRASAVLENVLDPDDGQEQTQAALPPQALLSFTSAMEALLQSLSGLETEPPPATELSAPEVTVDPAKAAPLLTELAGFLRQNSFETAAVRDTLRKALQGSAEASLFQELEKRLSRYDFENALHALHDIAKKLHLSLPEDTP